MLFTGLVKSDKKCTRKSSSMHYYYYCIKFITNIFLLKIFLFYYKKTDFFYRSMKIPMIKCHLFNFVIYEMFQQFFWNTRLVNVESKQNMHC